MQMTIGSEKHENIKQKSRTEREIEELEEKIQDELIQLNLDIDTGILTTKLMYHILMFYVEAYRLDDDIVRRECLKYFQINTDDYLNKIP